MNNMSPPATSLPVELAEPILSRAIHLVAVTSRWKPTAIAQPLNVLPRSIAPLATKATLMHLPHIDLDTATKLGDIGLLRLMRSWSKQPGGRPINYTATLELAMQAGIVDMLDWWMDESGLLVNWQAPSLELACRQGHVHVLEWWQKRGFPHLDKIPISNCIREASVAGHAHILDWLLAHFPGDEFADGVKMISHMVPQSAAQQGHTSVLDWWYSKGCEGLVEMLPLGKVVIGGLSGKHVPVLEWCEQHPETVEQSNAVLKSNLLDVLMHAVNGKLLDWIDRLGITFSDEEYWSASEAACRNGDLSAIQWLHRKGFLVGSRGQLVALAVPAASLDTLEWIHAHVDVAALAGFMRIAQDYNPIDSGRMHVLEWLLANGYELDEAMVASSFGIASRREHIVMLDWLLAEISQVGMRLEDMVSDNLVRDTILSSNSVQVLDWWLGKLAVHDLFLVSEDGSVDASMYLKDPCSKANVPVLKWWLNLMRNDQLSNRVQYGRQYKHLCAVGGKWERPQDCIEALQLWYDSGVPIDLVLCIFVASGQGRIDILDWLFFTVKAPLDAFVRAFHNEDLPLHEWGVLQRLYKNCHGPSLLWWRYNVPQVCSTFVARGWFPNPIYIHVLRTMLKIDKFHAQNPASAAATGNLALLAYMTAESPEYRDDLEDELERTLAEASVKGNCHVLEWLCKHSGVAVTECPWHIVTGDFEVHDYVATWWRESGLCPDGIQQP